MECIHCGKCTKNCDFLKKYDLDLMGFAQRPELAYHCFLCGECTACCPKNISGEKIALEMRRKRLKQEKGKFSRLPEYKAQRMLLLEKKRYLFRNYRHMSKGSLLFPGCNFPSLYPKTTRKLISLLQERAGMGVIMDCCGKPIQELGLDQQYKMIQEALSKRLHKAGVTELVVLCPNCYYFLKENLDIPVISIYKKLHQLGLVEPALMEPVDLFVPCPDKKSGEILNDFRPLICGEIKMIEDIQCCGLGGCASSYEREISRGFGERLKDKNLTHVYTYCASCSGKLAGSGCKEVHHILVELLGGKEQLPLGLGPLLNRIGWRFF